MESLGVIRSIRRYLDTDRKRRASPNTLCVLGILVWTALCAVGYTWLRSMHESLSTESATPEALQSLAAIETLLGAWWPFIWTVPTLIVAGVGFALRKLAVRTTDASHDS